jgi:hypothetical protein
MPEKNRLVEQKSKQFDTRNRHVLLGNEPTFGDQILRYTSGSGNVARPNVLRQSPFHRESSLTLPLHHEAATPTEPRPVARAATPAEPRVVSAFRSPLNLRLSQRIQISLQLRFVVR